MTRRPRPRHGVSGVRLLRRDRSRQRPLPQRRLLAPVVRGDPDAPAGRRRAAVMPGEPLVAPARTGPCPAASAPSTSARPREVHSTTSARPDAPDGARERRSPSASRSARCRTRVRAAWPAEGSCTSCHVRAAVGGGVREGAAAGVGRRGAGGDEHVPFTATLSNQPSVRARRRRQLLQRPRRAVGEVQTAGRPRGASLTAGSLRPPTAT